MMASQAKIRTVIADDETPARNRIRQLLKDEPDFDIVAECANGRQAVESIRAQDPDLAFLDVQMPGLSGTEVCDAILAAGGKLPLIIFVTAYDEYALKAFEVHATDYVLKPFDRERFRKAVAHVRQQFASTKTSEPDARLAAILQELRPGSRRAGRLIFKQNGRVIFVRTDTIDWIEADGNYVKVHAGPESHYVRETLAKLEQQLANESFLRISRSVIVNLDRVKEMQPMFYGDYVVILQNGSRLNLSRSYRDRLEAFLDQRG